MKARYLQEIRVVSKYSESYITFLTRLIYTVIVKRKGHRYGGTIL